MNSELLKQALAKVLNPHVLVNLVSRRVRQLNAGYGGLSRPLLADTASLGVADIALLEIIEDKMGFDLPEIVPLTRPTGRDRRKPQGWGKRYDVTHNGET
jgi:DNA-directed RNA polymerase subunit omega